MKATINANGTEITVLSKGDENDYISLTDIARYKNPAEPKDVVKNWMRNRSTIEFLGLWEQLNNPNFKGVEFDSFKYEAGSNAFTLSPQKWISSTNAMGLISKSGQYGGTIAHKDIAFEFASWVSAEFKLYIIKDYQRLKADENSRISLEWNVNMIISNINYRIHTEAIKDNIIPSLVTKGQQLIVLSNLESMNAELIKQKLLQNQKLTILNKMAIEQMTSLWGSSTIKKLQQTGEHK
jgi:hypothetical protein